MDCQEEGGDRSSTLTSTGDIIANSGPVTLQQLGAPAIDGAIAGGAGALAGPLGGTLAKGVGQLATGWLARGLNVGISAGGGALGETVASWIDSCHRHSPADGALWSGIGGLVASRFVPKGLLDTLRQASSFAPRHLPSMWSTPSARWISGSFAAAAGVSAAANFGGPFPSP